jgi:nucleoside-diphosphate-sugar epimerase
MLDSKSILVTGGAGFLGSHLCDRLIADGHEVICVDNFFTGIKRNVAHLLGHPRFELVRHDVTFPLYLEVDEIYNLAYPASPIHHQHDPVQTTKTSVHGAINMLGLAKRLKCRIFQASTSEIYGDPAIHPQPERYWGNVNPIGPRSCYDEGKRCAETLFFDYFRQHKLEIKIARIFNTYGPRMHPNDGRVVSNFIVQALKGEPITSMLLRAVAPLALAEGGASLKTSFAGIPRSPLPTRVVARAKTGFTTPVAAWLQNSRRPAPHNTVAALARPAVHWSRRWAASVAAA